MCTSVRQRANTVAVLYTYMDFMYANGPDFCANDFGARLFYKVMPRAHTCISI